MAGKDDSSPLAGLDRTKVLVADDEMSISKTLVQIISAGIPGCRVDAVSNGVEAVAAFRDIHYCVILMDVRMPELDGIKAFDEIMQVCKEENIEEPAVIFCTGYEPSDALRRRIVSQPQHGVLRKPSKSEDLIEALRSRIMGLPR